MATRDFRKAATLFLDSLSTFTATELCSYNQFVFYTVVTAMVALDRVSLKKRVVDTPEILAVLGQLPNMESFLNGLYNCKYKARLSRGIPPTEVLTSCWGLQEFMAAFPGVADQVRADMHLHKHFRYFLREARVTAYAQARPSCPCELSPFCKLTRLRPRTQFLESYKSVTIEMMASAFGVSASFLDSELSEFIAAGRLNCKIDKARDARTEQLV